MAEFDPFAFVPRFGAIQRSGRDYVFKRAGRDLSDFTDLLQFGTVRATGDRVILTLHQQTKTLGVKVARQERRVGVVEKELGSVRTKVARLSGELKASRVTRKQGLLNKGVGITNGGINAGIMTLGKGGPKLNMGMVRNAAGRAFTATIVAHVAGSAINEVADGIEATKNLQAQGAKPDELARKGAQSAMRKIVETAGSISGLTSITKGILRIGGKTGEEADESINSFFERMSTTREERERKAKRVADAIEKAVAAERDKHDREWAKLTSTPPAGFMLAGKREASTYRRDIRKMNAEQWRANRKRDEDKARKEVQLAAQGGV